MRMCCICILAADVEHLRCKARLQELVGPPLNMHPALPASCAPSSILMCLLSLHHSAQLAGDVPTSTTMLHALQAEVEFERGLQWLLLS